MKTLLLLRHADAEAHAANGNDKARTLTRAGEAQAAAQGRVLRDLALAPGKVLVSTALRATETARLLAEAHGGGLVPEPVDDLYNAPGEALLAQAQALPDTVDRVLLVAHMPGIGHLLSILVTEHVDLEVAFVAGALAEVRADIGRWRDLDYGTGALALFLPPPKAP